MIVRTIRYYRIPDPLKRGSEVVIADEAALSKTISEVYNITKNSSLNTPRLFRVLLSPYRIEADDALSGVTAFEHAYVKRKVDLHNRLKLREFLLLAKGLAIGYFLTFMPSQFWAPLDVFTGIIGEGLGSWVKMWICAFFPLRALIQSFGTGVYIELPRFLINNPLYRKIPIIRHIRRIGTTGRWSDIEEGSKAFTLFRDFGKSRREQCRKDVEAAVRNIEEKVAFKQSSSFMKLLRNTGPGCLLRRKKYPLSEKVKESAFALLDETKVFTDSELDAWSSGFDVLLQHASEEAESGGIFPWGEVPKLLAMKEDLLFHAKNTHFIFAPFLVVHPDTDPTTLFKETGAFPEMNEIDIQLMTIAQGLCSQARHLKEFLDNRETKTLQEDIYSAYTSLEIAMEKKERKVLLERITDCFETLRNRLKGYHMGENPDIPHEKGQDLTNFYHFLYLCFGRASCDLENKYKKVFFGFRPLLSGGAQRKRVREAIDEVNLLIYQQRESIFTRIREKLFSFLGRNPLSGLATCLCILFLFGSLLGFYTLKPDEFGIERSFRLGFRETEKNIENVSTGEKIKYWLGYEDTVKVIRYGSGIRVPWFETDLHWHLLSPFVSHHTVSLTEKQHISVYMPTLKYYPEGLWERAKTMLSGPLGMDFIAVEFSIHFTPANPEIWGHYDFDGLGRQRLMRDVSNLVEEWKTDRIITIREEIDDPNLMTYVYDTYFGQLCRRGIIQDFIRNSFSTSAMSSNIYYGSTLERIKPGFDIITDELERKEREYDYMKTLPDDQRKRLISGIEEAKRIVEQTYNEVRERVAVEYGELRLHPKRLNEYVENPYGHITHFEEFETLWGSIQYYTWYVYAHEKLLEQFSVEKKRGESTLIDELADKLAHDSHIGSLITIDTIDYTITVVGLAQLNLLQRTWRDIM
jgi:hypothetical protein